MAFFGCFGLFLAVIGLGISKHSKFHCGLKFIGGFNKANMSLHFCLGEILQVIAVEKQAFS